MPEIVITADVPSGDFDLREQGFAALDAALDALHALGFEARGSLAVDGVTCGGMTRSVNIIAAEVQ